MGREIQAWGGHLSGLSLSNLCPLFDGCKKYLLEKITNMQNREPSIYKSPTRRVPLGLIFRRLNDERSFMHTEF